MKVTCKNKYKGLLIQAVKVADLGQIYDVLNVLGRTPWRINNDVLDIVEKLWDEGGGVGEIPLKYYDYSDYVSIY